jgi:hypothetical protein
MQQQSHWLHLLASITAFEGQRRRWRGEASRVWAAVLRAGEGLQRGQDGRGPACGRYGGGTSSASTSSPCPSPIRRRPAPNLLRPSTVGSVARRKDSSCPLLRLLSSLLLLMLVVVSSPRHHIVTLSQQHPPHGPVCVLCRCDSSPNRKDREGLGDAVTPFPMVEEESPVPHSHSPFLSHPILCPRARLHACTPARASTLPEPVLHVHQRMHDQTRT